MADLTSVITGAVAAAKEANPDLEAEEIAAGDIPGTAEPDADDDGGSDHTDDGSAGDADDTSASAEADKADAAKPEVKPEEKPAESAEDKFAAEHDLKSKDSLGRENRIPYSRVKKISENAVRKAIEPLQAKVTEYEAAIAERDGRLEQVGQVEHVMFNEHDQFIDILLTIDGYADKLAARFGGTAATGKPATSADAAVSGDIPDDPGDLPEPEVDLGDGNKSYGPEGIRKLMTWAAATGARDAALRLTKRYEPLEKSFKAAQEDRKRREAMQQTQAQNEATLADAMGWEGFKEHYNDILQVLKDDSAQAAKTGKYKHNLHSAYRSVLFGKRTDERQRMRDELLAEMKGAPASTAIAPGSRKATEPDDSRPRDLEDVIRQSIKGLR